MSDEWGVEKVEKPEDVRKFLSAEALEMIAGNFSYQYASQTLEFCFNPGVRDDLRCLTLVLYGEPLTFVEGIPIYKDAIIRFANIINFLVKKRAFYRVFWGPVGIPLAQEYQATLTMRIKYKYPRTLLVFYVLSKKSKDGLNTLLTDNGFTAQFGEEGSFVQDESNPLNEHVEM